MAIAYIYSNLQNLWPFKFDDIKASNALIEKLSLPEQTKQFVFAVFQPETQSTIYILSAQNLSEQSAFDAQTLIRAIKPDGVVAQVGNFSLSDIQLEEGEFCDPVNNAVPTSSFEVVKRCFVHKINKEKYENLAENLVLRDIFGVGFHGHLLLAEKTAKEVGSSFLVMESPFVKSLVSEEEISCNDDPGFGYKLQGLVSSFSPRKMASSVSWSSQRLCITNDVQLQMVRFLTSCLDVSASKLSSSSGNTEDGTEKLQPKSTYEAPPFAQSIYALLTDLHSIFSGLPMLGRALGHAQKMLSDVYSGEQVDTKLLHEVYAFRIAVEGLRIALNSAGRLPIQKMGNPGVNKTEFSNLSLEDKSHALLAQALRSQGKKFKTVVAVVDASTLGGIRKHWNTPVPDDVKNMVGELVTNCDDDISDDAPRKGILVGKPVVAVGAGATAILGVSSLSKAVPASTFVKIMTFKVPASLKLILTQTHKAVAMAIGKTVGPSKLVAHGMASSGVKSTSILKASASAEKIRVISHSVIASMEKTSFSAMRAAFYEIMRKRRVKVRPIGILPWATFGCSISACTGLLVYGDGIECAVESLPAAPSIASLGRGIESLHQASQAARQTDSFNLQKSIESLMYRIKKAKVQ